MSNKERDEKEQAIKETQCTIKSQIMDLKMKTALKIILSSIIGPLILYGIFYIYLHYQAHLRFGEPMAITRENRPKFWIYAKSNDTGYLKHVYAVLQRLGFQESNNESNWDLLWAHDYPFRVLSTSLNKLREHQRVNHFPGCGYITNKVDLSTSRGGRYIPVAFKMPEDREAFLEYARLNPAKQFVQKSNDHRGIRIRNGSDAMNFSAGTFVQEFIERPFLADGYKFDIGVYTVITSVDPLRVYVYTGDVLFRFCPIKYYPFDSEVLDKYVVGDDYLPIWNVPSLKKYYTELGYSMKDSFDAYVREQKKNPAEMWERVYDAIREVALMKETQIREIAVRFGNGRNFFELVRFDLALDEDLNVYMMEANMSPNLSSAHYPPNQLLYEQVIFNTFALVGIGKRIRKESLKTRSKAEEEMEVANKNIVVLPELCKECDDCFRVECQLCKPCFTPETKLILSQSYLEHQNRMDFQRIFPPPITKDMVLKDYTLRNQLLIRWYQGKCELHKTWCS